LPQLSYSHAILRRDFSYSIAGIPEEWCYPVDAATVLM
jgi:hypothetical protein